MKSNEICHVTTTSFHDELDSTDYPFEAKRYWLFTSKLCPFAHRAEIVRVLSKLTDVIGLTIAGSIQTDQGWSLGERYTSHGSSPSPVEGISRLPGIYELSRSGYAGSVSVPVLFDTKSNTIINNESAEIIVQLDQIAVRHFAYPSLYPPTKRDIIDQLINQLEDEFISPIYRAGFAKDQQSYHLNFNQVFNYLTKLNQHLAGYGRYIAGEQLTLADVHAFPHLSRFDSVYHSLYHLSLHYLSNYPHITAYMSRLSQVPAFAETLDVTALKEGYYRSWNQPTDGHFIPEGPLVNPRSGIAIIAKEK
jgi:putative glutathione S-transferase